MLAILPHPTIAPAQQPVENVAAFAHLYGVTRWFYPSDAAAALDWDRFAVEGVRRVRAARTPGELESTLNELFMPLGPGILIGSSLPTARATAGRNPDLVAWYYRGAGLSELGAGVYSAKRMNRSTPPRNSTMELSGILSQVIMADSLRGRSIRMRGLVRVADPNSRGWAGLWLRVDREGGETGFFDNMQGRPVRDSTWRAYQIEGPIADDAARITVGALSIAGTTVDVDAIEISTRSPDGEWTPLVIQDAGFEASAGDGSGGWNQGGAFSFTRLSAGAAQGTQFIRLAPAEAKASMPERPVDSLETPRAGETVDVALARGVTARIAISLTDAEARTTAAGLTALETSLAAVGAIIRRDDADVRLADVVVAWSALRHFYPYWRDVDIDWDARLRPQLLAALEADTTRKAHHDALRAVVADLRDGHGNVIDNNGPTQWMLPIQVRVLQGQVVVTATNDSTVPAGAIVLALNGTPAGGLVRESMQLASGTPQWREVRAENQLPLCRLGTQVTLRIESPMGGRRDVTLPCDRSVARAVETRPDSISEIEPGIWYVDLTRLRAAQLTPMLPALAAARGVVFDLRGYPTDVGLAVLPHLMRSPEEPTGTWMHLPLITRPFGEVDGWRSMSWNLRPAMPQITAKRVFLTDGRAISYAESVMGYVRDYNLGTIIGGTTAGANGNVASFSVPGGFTILFTGMRVTRHDGQTPFHAIGVSPDIPVQPTLAGIRQGRDELLERALAELRLPR